MIRFIGPAGVVSVLVVSIFFATLNGVQRVTLNLGVTVLYGVPLTLVGFTGLFMGMVVMLVAGVRSDLKVRALLRQRLEDEDRDERALIDRTQQDLFAPPPLADGWDRVADRHRGGDGVGDRVGDGDREGDGAGDGNRDGVGDRVADWEGDAEEVP
jgi:hypothetical protein